MHGAIDVLPHLLFGTPHKRLVLLSRAGLNRHSARFHVAASAHGWHGDCRPMMESPFCERVDESERQDRGPSNPIVPQSGSAVVNVSGGFGGSVSETPERRHGRDDDIPLAGKQQENVRNNVGPPSSMPSLEAWPLIPEMASGLVT